MSKDQIPFEASDTHINLITLLSVHVNTTFGFINENGFIVIETTM